MLDNFTHYSIFTVKYSSRKHLFIITLWQLANKWSTLFKMRSHISEGSIFFRRFWLLFFLLFCAMTVLVLDAALLIFHCFTTQTFAIKLLNDMERLRLPWSCICCCIDCCFKVCYWWQPKARSFGTTWLNAVKVFFPQMGGPFVAKKTLCPINIGLCVLFP